MTAPKLPSSFGYLKDPEDVRDVDMFDAPAILKVARHPHSALHRIAVKRRKVRPVGKKTPAAVPAVPKQLSLRDKCSPVFDQGHLNACTAHAAAALMVLVQAHLNRRVYSGSRMFLYKVTRSLLQWTGDTGAYLRTAAGSLTLFGLPPEDYWPYDPAKLDVEPPAFCYMLAQQYRASTYFRLDSAGVSPKELVDRIRALLGQGLPTMFGYDVYAGAEFQARASGNIPVPLPTDIKVGGHAMLICGYDDDHSITNTSAGGETTKGAFLVQNSRGTGWGDKGFGWMPYEYFLRKIAVDCWSVINMCWVDLQPFEQLPAPAPAPTPAPNRPAG